MMRSNGLEGVQSNTVEKYLLCNKTIKKEFSKLIITHEMRRNNKETAKYKHR